MPPELPAMTLLQQRYIEARVLGPMLRAFQKELGVERANKIALRAIHEISRQRGRDLARSMGRNDLQAFAEVAKSWRGQGDLEIETLRSDASHHDFNVTRCRFAETYREMGLGDIGHILSCARDGALIEGFNKRIKLTRTQTIMQGAPFCNFRYEVVEEEGDTPAQQEG